MRRKVRTESTKTWGSPCVCLEMIVQSYKPARWVDISSGDSDLGGFGLNAVPSDTVSLYHLRKAVSAISIHLSAASISGAELIT